MADTFFFTIDPVGKPRMTQRDVWKKRPCVVRYREFADELRAQAAQLKFTVPESGMIIAFVLPMPKSWSKKKRDEMKFQPHLGKPDIDNLLKAFLDVLVPEDSVIWNLGGLEKRWGEHGEIVVTTGSGLGTGMLGTTKRVPLHPG